MIRQDHRATRDAFASLLDALAREVVDAEVLDIEASAKARRSMADVKEEEVETAREIVSQAHDHVDAFRTALLDAREREREGSTPYDTTDPVQNAQADVLIQYLVRPGFAQAHTAERAGGGYVCHVSVDWPRLESLADRLGHRLSL